MGASSRKLLASAFASAPAPPLAPQHDEKSLTVLVASLVYVYAFLLLLVILLIACYKGRHWRPTRRDPAEEEDEDDDELVLRYLQVGVPPALGGSWILGNLVAASAAGDYLELETGAARERARRYLEAMPVGVHAAAEPEEACCICLGEYEDGEEVRLLEKCNHKYHKNCIDPWLILRGKCCPLCREVAIPA